MELRRSIQARQQRLHDEHGDADRPDEHRPSRMPSETRDDQRNRGDTSGHSSQCARQRERRGTGHRHRGARDAIERGEQRVRRISGESLHTSHRNRHRDEEERLQEPHHRVGEQVGHWPEQRHAPKRPGHERRGDSSGHDADHAACSQRATPSPPSLRNDPSRQRSTGDERRGAGHTELPSEIERGARVPERCSRSERENGPRRGRPLNEASHEERTQHHGGAHGRRRRADSRDVNGQQDNGGDARWCSRQSQHGGEQIERERNDADMQSGHAEHVYQPGTRIAIALLGGDGAHIRDDERARDWRVVAKDAIDSPAGCGTCPQQVTRPYGRRDHDVGDEEVAFARRRATHYRCPITAARGAVVDEQCRTRCASVATHCHMGHVAGNDVEFEVGTPLARGGKTRDAAHVGLLHRHRDEHRRGGDRGYRCQSAAPDESQASGASERQRAQPHARGIADAQ